MSNEQHLIDGLPDPGSARRFLCELAAKDPKRSADLLNNPGLFSDVLTIVSYSPLLATTLLQNPNYISWLKRRRADAGGRSKEELIESLARFALTNSRFDTQILLARFRRRELLRIFLRDIRRIATIAEITEEISNLADAILEHALRVARQELENRYGLPLDADEKGRSRPSRFCIVSLGKLGSLELNYSSDIDLLFLYSGEGNTAGAETRGSITNREFSIKLAERVTKLVGEQVGEGAAYRVDLRLRPHGRIGPLAMSVNDSVRYYRTEARGWERQVMIRSRASAGDAEVFKAFFTAIEDSVFSTAESVEHALQDVRLSKERINNEMKGERGFNVKLGRGGIREIEFIAQALQLAYGGKDRWLRSSHTLISLSRIADRGLLTSRELTELFDAYGFLRRLEHILQMEHGVQTHTLPDDPNKKQLIAAKMEPADPSGFEKQLHKSTHHVSCVFERIFASPMVEPKRRAVSATNETAENRNRISLHSRHAAAIETAKYPPAKATTIEQIREISPRFEYLLRSDPTLVDAVPDASDEFLPNNYRDDLTAAVANARDYRSRLGELRRAWHRSLLRIVAFDVLGKLSLSDAKSQQTLLAEASIDCAFMIAADEIARRLSVRSTPLKASALAVGKLGGRGVDYDSDLDLILVYDDSEPPPDPKLTNAEFFGRATEIFVSALSSMTREGSLYRVDLRLRPHGKNGQNCVSVHALSDYVADEAAVWELLAYAKVRAAGGDHDLARTAEIAVRKAIHARAQTIDIGEFGEVTRSVRRRLEKERAGRMKTNEVDIKYGSGGLLDIYFATRFLQLRDNIPDDDEDRSTQAILKNLHKNGALAFADFKAFSDGHGFMSNLDHSIRLAVGRSTRVPTSNENAMKIITVRLGLASPADVLHVLTLHRIEVRKAFERILGA